MNYDREFLTGTVGVLILSLLGERAMYGYEILREAERRSARQFQMKEGTLYPPFIRWNALGSSSTVAILARLDLTFLKLLGPRA